MTRLVYKNQNVLVLAPHADDETLGCGGVIQKYIEQGSHIRVLIASFTFGESKRFKMDANLYNIYRGDKRFLEFENAMRILGVTDYQILYEDHTGKQEIDGKLEQMPRIELVGKIEKHMKELNPTAIFIPSITKHQDHEALHQAAIAAARPYFWNGSIFVYETDGEISYQPNMFVPLTEVEINTKIQALKAYETQLGSSRHPVNPEILLHKAKFRGNQIYEEYAEAFQVIRIRG